MCAEESLDFVCPAGSAVSVEYALFGQPGGPQPFACPSTPQEKDCAAPNSLLTLIQRFPFPFHLKQRWLTTVLAIRCQGKQSCELGSVRSVFPEQPCLPGDGNFLEYRFACAEALDHCPQGSKFFAGRCFEVVHVEVALTRDSGGRG